MADGGTEVMDNSALKKKVSAGWRPSSQPRSSWHDRGLLAAQLLRRGDVVCDLGAGSQSYKTAFPAGVEYLPVDYFDAIPGTHLADFNDPAFTLPEAPYNVVTALGVINWLDDPKVFFSRLCELAEGKFFIFTYDLWPPKKTKRRTAHSGMDTMEGAVQAFSPYVQNLRAVFVYRRRVMFSGSLGRGEPSTLSGTPATKIYLKYLRPQEYFIMKLFKLDVMPSWLA